MTGALLTFAVALAGALGAMARFAVDSGLDGRLASRQRRPASPPGPAPDPIPSPTSRPTARLTSRSARPFPWATLLVNVSGSLLLGLLAGLAARQGLGAQMSTVSTVFTVLGVGFCGGYTTFSTASVGTVMLLREGRFVAAAGNALGTLALTVVVAAIGLWLGSR